MAYGTYYNGFNGVNPYYPTAAPGVNNPYQQPPVAQPVPQPVQNPVQNVQNSQNTIQNGTNGMLWCSGEEEAKAWIVQPGSTVFIMDRDGSSFYLKSTDASGMPQPLRVFDYKERVNAPKSPDSAASFNSVEYVTREEFDRLAEELAVLKANKATNTKKNTKETE